MSITAQRQQKERTQMVLPKKGMRLAILTGIVDTGVHVREYLGEEKPPCREFVPIFTLVNDTYETEEGEVRNCSVRQYPMKMLPGATRGNYFDFIQAVDPEARILESGGFGDISLLIGQPCYVNISYSNPDKDGFVYANINGISAIPEDLHVPTIEYTEFVFSTENPDKETFDKLNPWLQDQVRQSQGYAGSALEAVLEAEVTTVTEGSEGTDSNEPW